MTQPEVSRLLQAYSEQLMALPGVVAVGEGVYQGQPCIKIFLQSPQPGLWAHLPTGLKDAAIVIEVSGEIRALGPE
ncbi:DUF2173 family protein [Photobacterium sp. SDRW27]|uniref:hypothetical protein n=1 Tax=Photobacterium obscurum TaxID=2829490 RepID=UPI0022443CC6|nr:hypothetical protein [Photobacterium obscurum]MCW8330804.1 DUF2173 family protein [Photobacterium obscurum]